MANEVARRWFGLSLTDFGRPIQDLELSYRPIELRPQLDAAVAERRMIDVSAIRFRQGEHERVLNIKIVPLMANGTPLGVGISYLDVTESHRLEQQLMVSREELEHAYEELQSTVEELETTNEELQSTNEELETTNEELQSTNAELDATNRELAHRTEEMNRFWFSQRTIIRSLSAAVVVIDPDGRVIMWNLAAERLLGIAESEAVGQTLWTLHVPALGRATLQRIRKTLADGRALRAEDVVYELPTGQSGHATLAAVPILDDKISRGAVLIFEDCTKQALLQEQLAAMKERVKSQGSDKGAGDNEPAGGGNGNSKTARTRR
jgi:PAS domain S-box-containing protein